LYFNFLSFLEEQEAASKGVNFLSLPECFSFIGSREGEALSIAEPLDGPILQKYKELARQGFSI
jgi:predicted amidohydrolase